MKYRNNTEFTHSRPSKIGVLMVNLGTPEAPTAKALKLYLKEFLSDPRVVEIPRLVWFFILNGIILPFRSKKSAHAYESVWTEQGSPLMFNTKQLSEAVQEQLSGEEVVVEFAMRYGQPSVDSQISEMLAKGVEQLLVLPLYPQYSATTSASVFDAVAQSFVDRRWFPELRFINQYHDDPAYISALADKVRAHWEVHGRAEKLMLSYHGIPKRNWDMGDPYACHCFKTSRLLTEELGLEKDDVLTCFQSRFGKAEWLQPYTEQTLKALPSQGIESVQVMCPGFSVDCLETLEEIAEENKEYFLEAGGKDYQYIECLNRDQAHVDVMKGIILKHIQGWTKQENRQDTQLRYQEKASAQ
jgi:ferrochelatase